MARGTRGIYRDGAGWQVDKYVCGVRLRSRFRSQAEADEWVLRESEKIRRLEKFGERPTMLFSAAALRFVEEKVAHEKPSAVTDAYLLKSMIPLVGHIPIDQMSDLSLDAWRNRLMKNGQLASTKTVRSGIALASSILRAAHRRWTIPGTNQPLLERVPYFRLPTLKGKQRPPRPLTRAEQERLLAELEPHQHSMALFLLNTGVRDDVVCNLRWDWYFDATPTMPAFFYVPKEHVKGRQVDRIIVLNSVALAVVEAQRGRHAEYVFTWRRERVKDFDKPAAMNYRPVATVNNTAWQSARRRADLGDLHVHDLRHTFGSRLRQAGVDHKTIQELLWHGNQTITEHYMGSTVRRLLTAVELIAKPPADGCNDLSLETMLAMGRARMKGTDDPSQRGRRADHESPKSPHAKEKRVSDLDR